MVRDLVCGRRYLGGLCHAILPQHCADRVRGPSRTHTGGVGRYSNSASRFCMQTVPHPALRAGSIYNVTLQAAWCIMKRTTLLVWGGSIHKAHQCVVCML